MQDSDTTQTAHVNDEGRPLCNQDGDYLHLCESDEFERLPKECRCKRCEQLLGYCGNGYSLSNSPQQLLTEISRRTPGDSWCAVIDLCKVKTESAITSLHRSLRQLEVQGLIELKTDSHNQDFVRLSGTKHSGSEYLFDVFTTNE